MFRRRFNLSPENIETVQVMTALGTLALVLLGLVAYAAAVT
jgi:hypothetical protein